MGKGTDSERETEEAQAAPEMSIEETLAALEEIVGKMEDVKSSLEETFACYEQGMRLVKECTGKIDRVEKKIRILSGEGQDNAF